PGLVSIVVPIHGRDDATSRSLVRPLVGTVWIPVLERTARDQELRLGALLFAGAELDEALASPSNPRFVIEVDIEHERLLGSQFAVRHPEAFDRRDAVEGLCSVRVVKEQNIRAGQRLVSLRQELNALLVA